MYSYGFCLEPSYKGNAAYTVVQVATNDLIILIAFTPIVCDASWSKRSKNPMGYFAFVSYSFRGNTTRRGINKRSYIIKRHGKNYLDQKFIPKFKHITIIGLLLTLVIIFSFQGKVILENPLHILLIAVHIDNSNSLIFFIAYFVSRSLKLPHNIAAPAGMIGASNFFELAVAVAISLFSAKSPVVSCHNCRCTCRGASNDFTW
jgi:ACR3 family arsenite transporter